MRSHAAVAGSELPIAQPPTGGIAGREIEPALALARLSAALNIPFPAQFDDFHIVNVDAVLGRRQVLATQAVAPSVTRFREAFLAALGMQQVAGNQGHAVVLVGTQVGIDSAAGRAAIWREVRRAVGADVYALCGGYRHGHHDTSVKVTMIMPTH